MATTLSRALVFAALLAAAPLLASKAAAQRSGGNVHASAFVTGPVQAYGLRADTVRVVASPEVQRLAIAGVGALEVQSEPGSVTRIVPREARVVRVTIDFVAN
jgi:hypothetical protein